MNQTGTTRLIDLIKLQALDLNSEFQKASLIGRGTPQEVADFRENAFTNLLARYFPFPQRVTKGQIYDTTGQSSNSIDCVILNAAHPHTIDALGKYSLILADGVDCAIELKPDLSKKDELRRGLGQVRTVKRLRRSQTPLLLVTKLSPGIVEHSLTIPSFVFTTKAKDIPSLVSDIHEYYRSEQVPVVEQYDYIVINGQGILSNRKLPELNPSTGIDSVKRATGYFFEEWKENTLAAMFLHINLSFSAVPHISEPILQRYLKHLRCETVLDYPASP